MAEEVDARLGLDTTQFQAAITQSQKDLGDLSKGFTEFSKSAENASKVVIQGMKDAQKAISTLSLGTVKAEFSELSKTLGGVFQGAIQPATDYEAALRRVNTIIKLNDTDLEQFGQRVKDSNAALGTAIPVAESLRASYEILSAGFTKTADNQKVLASTMVLASADSVDLKDAARVLTGTLNAYGASAEDAAKYTDILFKSVDIGVTTVPELAQSLGQVVPTAALAGVSFKEVAAAISVLTQRGLNTPQAITGLNAALNSFIKPSKQSKDALFDLGLEISATSLKSDGLAATLAKVFAATKNQPEVFTKIFGNTRAIRAVGSLGNDDGRQLFEAEKTLDNSGGAAQAALGERNKTLANQTKILANEFNNLATTVGERLLPAQKVLVEFGGTVLGVFSGLPTGVLATGVALAGMAAAGAAAVAGLAGLGIALPALYNGFSGLTGAIAIHLPAARAFFLQEVSLTEAIVAASVAIKAQAVALDESALAFITSGTAMASTGAAAKAFATSTALSTTLLFGLGAALIFAATEYVHLSEAADKAAAAKANYDGGLNPDGSKRFKNKTNAGLNELLAGKPGEGGHRATEDDYKFAIEGQQLKAAALRSSLSEKSKANRVEGLVDPESGLPWEGSKTRPNTPDEDAAIAADKKTLRTVVDNLNALATKKKLLVESDKRFDKASGLAATGSRASYSTPGAQSEAHKDAYQDQKNEILDGDGSNKEKAAALRALLAKFTKAPGVGPRASTLSAVGPTSGLGASIIAADESRAATNPLLSFDKKELRKENKTIAGFDKAASKEDKKKAKEEEEQGYKNSLADISASTANHATKIAQIKALGALSATTDERVRQLNKLIAAEQTAAFKDQLDAKKKLLEADLLANKVKQSELDDAHSKGANNTEARNANVRARAAIEANIVVNETNKATARATPDQKKALRKAADAKIGDQNQAATDKVKSNDEGAGDDAIAKAKDQNDYATRSTARRIDLLKEEGAAGKDVTDKLNAAIREQVKEKEISIKQDLEAIKSANANDPIKIANAEKEAVELINEARRQGKKDIDAATQALIDQKAAQDALQPKAGTPYDLDTYVKSQQMDDSAQFSKAFASSTLDGAGNSNGSGFLGGVATAADLTSGTKVSNGDYLSRNSGGTSTGNCFGPGGSNGPPAQQVDVQGVFRLLDSNGNKAAEDVKINQPRVSTNGFGNTIARTAERMGGSNGGI